MSTLVKSLSAPLRHLHLTAMSRKFVQVSTPPCHPTQLTLAGPTQVRTHSPTDHHRLIHQGYCCKSPSVPPRTAPHLDTSIPGPIEVTDEVGLPSSVPSPPHLARLGPLCKCPSLHVPHVPRLRHCLWRLHPHDQVCLLCSVHVLARSCPRDLGTSCTQRMHNLS